MGVPRQFVKNALNIFDQTVMSISTKDGHVGEIKSNIGVLQGDALSALLFNCYISDLADELAL